MCLCAAVQFIFTSSRTEWRLCRSPPPHCPARRQQMQQRSSPAAWGQLFLSSRGKFWRFCSSSLSLSLSSPSALNLLIITVFYYRYFSRNIFVPFFMAGPAQVLYSRSGCQKISHKLDCIKSRSLYCSGEKNILLTKTRGGKIKKSTDRNTFIHFLRSSAQWLHGW